MIGKIIVVVMVLAMLVFSIVFFYQNVPGAPVELRDNYIAPETIELVDYGSVPVFADNLRFNHNLISYYIDNSCSDIRRDAMTDAFNIFSNKMGIISFYEVNNEADIDVGCSNDYIPMGEQLFAAGEGGPSRIINTSMIKTIEKGKIFLYNDPRCDYPVVEVHELGHVFGFDHSLDPKNIMYNTSNCEQRISDDMVKLINELYSIEPLADIVLKDVVAIKRGIYLDFNLSILNEGMVGVDNFNLSIFGDEELVQNIGVSPIDIGYGRTLTTTGIRLNSRNTNIIEFIVDYENVIPELREDNNRVQVKAN